MSGDLSAFVRRMFLKEEEARPENETEIKLRTLQEQHRLAIHCFEDSDAKKLYSPRALEGLAANAKAPLAELLRSGNPALFSMTLLPGPDRGITLYSICNPAYLFDLTVAGKDSPALVAKVLKHGGDTGESLYLKRLHFGEGAGLEALNALYQNHSADSFKKAVADHPHLSEEQLDALGDYYRSCNPSYDPHHFNEVLAAVRKEHIAAIAIPFGLSSITPAYAKLEGALTGLVQLERGIDVPVVLYHFCGASAGKCVYIDRQLKERAHVR